jgi:hypothetical protein
MSKNPNSPWGRLKKALSIRWGAADYPGGTPRFQATLFAKDAAVYFGLPLLAVILVKACDKAIEPPKRKATESSQFDRNKLESQRSQIIHFGGPAAPRTGSGIQRRSPGSLVRVRLLNVVETYSSAPVQAQIVDSSLGVALQGGTLIGDATPDTSFDRMLIVFRYARDPYRAGVATQINARALSLDGTLGLDANKKEGFVARSAIGSAASGSQDLQKGSGSNNLQDMLIKALTSGLLQELGTSSQVERNRAQILTLPPRTEFFAELTDFFPGGSR